LRIGISDDRIDIRVLTWSKGLTHSAGHAMTRLMLAQPGITRLSGDGAKHV
jgi:hypothetical protein